MRAVLRPSGADDGHLVEMVAKLVIAAVSVALAAILICGCVPVEDAPAEVLPPAEIQPLNETVATEHANGMPLDAIEYDPPAWIPWCGRAYMVCDRMSGQQWWLLVMENQDMHGRRDASYVVLPIGGSAQ